MKQISILFSSSTANGMEFTVSGVVILVTLTSTNTYGKGLTSSFALRFIRTRNDFVLIPGTILYPSSFVAAEGPAKASFPENNAKDYENNANHFMLISRPSGRDFNITRTFTDTEPEKDYVRGFYLKDDAVKTWFTYYGV